jgi:hypothetical protein
MGFAMGFAFSINSSTINRTKKPFNPLLAETFELYDPVKKFRFLSEQVSHHPPISAGYCDNDNFEYWSNTNVKISFWGRSIEAKPLGSSHIKLKKHNDHFIYTKNNTIIQNIIIGKMYIDHYGDMAFTNHTTKDTGVITMKQRGWGDRGAYEAEGYIKDASGRERYKIKGRWDKDLYLIDVNTKQQIKVWERNPMPQNSEMQYHFTEFAKQLNFLN